MSQVSEVRAHHLYAQLPCTSHAGRHLLPLGQALIAAESANLGHQLLLFADPLRDNRIQAMPDGLGQSAITSDSPAGQRLPQRFGDERDHRVQQPQQRVQYRGQHARWCA